MTLSDHRKIEKSWRRKLFFFFIFIEVFFFLHCWSIALLIDFACFLDVRSLFLSHSLAHDLLVATHNKTSILKPNDQSSSSSSSSETLYSAIKIDNKHRKRRKKKKYQRDLIWELINLSHLHPHHITPDKAPFWNKLSIPSFVSLLNKRKKEAEEERKKKSEKNEIYIVKNIMASSSKESTNKRYSAFSFTQFCLLLRWNLHDSIMDARKSEGGDGDTQRSER